MELLNHMNKILNIPCSVNCIIKDNNKLEDYCYICTNKQECMDKCIRYGCTNKDTCSSVIKEEIEGCGYVMRCMSRERISTSKCNVYSINICCSSCEDIDICERRCIISKMYNSNGKLECNQYRYEVG